MDAYLSVLPQGFRPVADGNPVGGVTIERENTPIRPRRNKKRYSDEIRLPVIPAGTMPVRGGTSAERVPPRAVSVLRVGAVGMTVTMMVGPITVAVGAGMRHGGRACEQSARKYQYRHTQKNAELTVMTWHNAPHPPGVAENYPDSPIWYPFPFLPSNSHFGEGSIWIPDSSHGYATNSCRRGLSKPLPRIRTLCTN